MGRSGRSHLAALPLDPKSAAARDFLAEWDALLAPFTALATPAMHQDVTQMYDHMGEWQQGENSPSPGFDAEVWDFMKAVRAAQG